MCVEAERAHGPAVGGHAIVVIMAPQHRPQPPPYRWDRSVKPFPKLALKFLELRPESLPHGMAKHHELAAVALTADVGEAKEVEGLRFLPPV